MENNNKIEKDSNLNFQDFFLDSLNSSCYDDNFKTINNTRVKRNLQKYQNYFENDKIHYSDCTFNKNTTESLKDKVYYNETEILDDDFSCPIKEQITYTKNHQLISDSEKKNYHFKKNKYHKRFKLPILITLFFTFLLGSIFCVHTILMWFQDNYDTNQNVKQIDEIVQVTEIKDNKNTELVNQPEQSESDYWYYIKFPLIQVDFQDLLKKNKDTVAWIQVNNTNINYPVVQTTNNDYYLSHSYDQSVNEAGWVFMDFRNNPDFSSKNTIIYAHSRLDKTMFGSLSKVLKESWYKNKENHIIKLSTPTENTLWNIFSVYKIKEESYYITTKFPDNDSYQTFLNTIKNRSKYQFNTELNTNDHVLTLSTCYSNTERTVVHAKLIKRSKR